MASTHPQVVTPRVMFAGPGLQVNGLEAVPEGLWLCDQRDDRSYLVDYTGKVVTSFASPARNASGITFGGGSVWVASNIRPAMIFRHDPRTGQCTAFIMLAGEGGVHGLQWRPYSAAPKGSKTIDIYFLKWFHKPTCGLSERSTKPRSCLPKRTQMVPRTDVRALRKLH